MGDEIAEVYLRLNLSIGVLFSWMQQLVLSSRCFYPRHTRNLGINHKPQDVCDVVEGKDAVLAGGPKPLVVGVALLHHCSYAVDHFGVVHCDLEVGALLVALEAQDILSHAHLH